MSSDFNSNGSDSGPSPLARPFAIDKCTIRTFEIHDMNLEGEVTLISPSERAQRTTWKIHFRVTPIAITLDWYRLCVCLATDLYVLSWKEGVHLGTKESLRGRGSERGLAGGKRGGHR